MTKVAALILLAFPLLINSQNHKYFRNGPVLSLKAGYHTQDDSGSSWTWDQSLPAGFSIDGTAEMPTGKNWYLGLNYDLSFGKDIRYEYNSSYAVERTYKIYNFSPILKHRFIVDKISYNVGFGIGSTSVIVNYNKPGYSETQDGLININLRAGLDYSLRAGLLLSSEIVYYGMAEIKFHGSGRSHNMFQFKAGLAYILGI